MFPSLQFSTGGHASHFSVPFHFPYVHWNVVLPLTCINPSLHAPIAVKLVREVLLTSKFLSGKDLERAHCLAAVTSGKPHRWSSSIRLPP